MNTPTDSRKDGGAAKWPLPPLPAMPERIAIMSADLQRVVRWYATDYAEHCVTAFAAASPPPAGKEWTFAGVDMASDLLHLEGIRNAIGASPDGDASFKEAAAGIARKMLAEFRKQLESAQ